MEDQAVLTPKEVFLKRRDGDRVGPLTLREIEVLYRLRVITDATPVALGATDFAPLAQVGPLFTHLAEFQKHAGTNGAWVDALSEEIPRPFHPLAVLFALAKDEHSGRARLSRNEGSEWVELSYAEGRIIDVSTSASFLRLDGFLLDHGVADHQTLEEVRAELGRGRLETVLVERGLSVERIREAASARAEAALAYLAGWQEGEAEIEIEHISAPDTAPELEPFSPITRAAREGVPASAIDALIEEAGHLSIVRGELSTPLEELGFDPVDSAAIESAPEAITLERAIAKLGAGRAVLHERRAIYYALEIGLLKLGADPRLELERDQAQRLLKQLETSMKTVSPFELFDVTEGTADAIVAAQRLALLERTFSEEPRQGAAQELVEAHQKVRAFIDNAFEEVRTAEARVALTGRVKQQLKDAAAEEKRVEAVLEAGSLFAQAEAQGRSKRYQEAFATICRAIDLNPDEPEYQVYRGYFRALKEGHSSKSAAHRAIREIKEIIERAGRDYVSAHMFLGQLFKTVGDTDQATKEFKLVLTFDRKHENALSELRLLKMRKNKGETKKKKKGWFGS